MDIRDVDLLKQSGKIKAPSIKCNKYKHCRFHRNQGHDTKECIQLKDKIDNLIEGGYLQQYQKYHRRDNNKKEEDIIKIKIEKKPQIAEMEIVSQQEQIFYVIKRGTSLGGDNISTRKTYVGSKKNHKIEFYKCTDV